MSVPLLCAGIVFIALSLLAVAESQQVDKGTDIINVTSPFYLYCLYLDAESI